MRWLATVDKPSAAVDHELAAGAYVLVIALVMALLQRVDETPQIDAR